MNTQNSLFKRFFVNSLPALLCVVILVGYFQSAIYLHFNVLFISRSANFSLASFFEERAGSFDLDLGQTDFSTLIPDSDVMAEVGARIIFGVGAYFLVLAVVVLLAALIILNKFRRGCVVFCALAAILFYAAGRVILTVPGLANGVLEDAILANPLLRFAAMLFDFSASEIIAMELGRGYWIILFGLVLLGLVQGAGIILDCKKGEITDERADI